MKAGVREEGGKKERTRGTNQIVFFKFDTFLDPMMWI
jgi:hypothetical protein